MFYLTEEEYNKLMGPNTTATEPSVLRQTNDKMPTKTWIFLSVSGVAVFILIVVIIIMVWKFQQKPKYRYTDVKRVIVMTPVSGH